MLKLEGAKGSLLRKGCFKQKPEGFNSLKNWRQKSSDRSFGGCEDLRNKRGWMHLRSWKNGVDEAEGAGRSVCA